MDTCTDDAGKRAVGHAAWRRSSLHLGFLPVPLYIGLIAALSIALPTELAASLVFDPPALMLVLNTIFLFGVAVAVAATAMRAYLASGATSILLLGSGVLALGTAALIGGWVRPLGGVANTSVTVHNLGVLLAAALHAMSGILTLLDTERERRAPRRRWRLVFGYAGTFLLFAGLTAASIGDLIPPFWVPGAGSTPLKQAVLATAITVFALTSVYVMVLYARTGRRFLYWYSLALALTAVGLIGISAMKAVGDPIGWAGRTAQYLGGVYFLVAALSVLREVRGHGLTLATAVDRFFRQSDVHYRDLVETVGDAIISVDETGRVLLWNPGAERMFGYTSDEATGRLLTGLLAPPGDPGRLDAALHALQVEQEAPFSARRLEIDLRRKDGTAFPAETSLAGRRIGSGWTGTLVVRDITERTRRVEQLHAALAEKDAALATNQALLREVHHRVKNNLQMLCDMLYLQMEGMADGEKAEVLRETYGRIYAIARLHEQLYQAMESGEVRLAAYLGRLIAGFENVYSAVPVVLDAPQADLTLDVDRAIHLGLIVNELVTNALKHAFAGRADGKVEVRLRQDGDQLALQVRDNGRGLPPDFDPEKARSLGLRIVYILARKQGGTVEMENRQGAVFTLRFPLHADAAVEPHTE